MESDSDYGPSGMAIISRSYLILGNEFLFLEIHFLEEKKIYFF